VPENGRELSCAALRNDRFFEKRVTIVLIAALSLISCRDDAANAAAAQPKIEVKAQVAPIEMVPVSAQFDGRVERVMLSEGAPVNAGDVVITLSNASVERDLAYARAQVAAAEWKLRAIATPTRRAAPNEWENVALQILREKEKKLERYRTMLKSGDVSLQEVQDVTVEVAAARRDWMGERDRRMTTPEQSDPSLLKMELERAKADLAVAEDRKTQLTLTAPAAGIVSHIMVKAGDRVFPRDALLEISNASNVRVTAQVAPELIRYVSVGQLVDVQVLTIPPHRFRERIAQVIPAGNAGGPALIVNVPNPDRMLQPGTPAVIAVR
jgi:multidrug resistance efflux pump